MRILSSWLGAGGIVVAAYLCGHATHSEAWMTGAISAGVTVTIVCAGWTAAAAAGGRRAGGTLLLVFFSACAVRGCVAGHGGGDADELLSATRGPARQFVAFEVTGASTPGTRCRIEATAEGAPVTLWVPADRCPLAAGDAIVVPAADLSPRIPVLDARPTAHLSTDAVFTVRRDDAEIYWHAVARMRQWAWEGTRGDRGRAFVAASAIGLVSAMPPEDRAGVRRAGIGHLIAISGMHVGFLALVVLRTTQRVLGPLGIGPRAAVAVSWVPVAAYVVATGAAAPAVRAAAMLAVAGVGAVLGRPTHGLTVVAVAAAAMLFMDPSWAVDPGFQLSVAAMIALVRLPPDAGLLHVSWQLQWAVLPVALVHFGPPAAGIVAANLLALPIFTVWVMPLAALGALAVPLFGPAAFDPAAAGAELILLVADEAAALPTLPSWSLAAVAALAIALRLAGIRRAFVPSFAAAAGVLGVLGVLAVAPPPPADVPPAHWIAIGGWRRPTVIAMGDPVACIEDPGDDPRRWPARLDALGIDAVALEWASKEEGVVPPHIAELREQLERGGRLAAGECSFPAPSVARSALRRCARVRGASSGAVAVAGPDAWCWLRGHWQPVRLESEVHDGD